VSTAAVASRGSRPPRLATAAVDTDGARARAPLALGRRLFPLDGTAVGRLDALPAADLSDAVPVRRRMAGSVVAGTADRPPAVDGRFALRPRVLARRRRPRRHRRHRDVGPCLPSSAYDAAPVRGGNELGSAQRPGPRQCADRHGTAHHGAAQLGCGRRVRRRHPAARGGHGGPGQRQHRSAQAAPRRSAGRQPVAGAGRPCPRRGRRAAAVPGRSRCRRPCPPAAMRPSPSWRPARRSR